MQYRPVEFRGDDGLASEDRRAHVHVLADLDGRPHAAARGDLSRISPLDWFGEWAAHRLAPLSHLRAVDDERAPVEIGEHTCPACERELSVAEQHRDAVVCTACDERFERLLHAWLDFAAIRDE
jgi:hypothetical protein